MHELARRLFTFRSMCLLVLWLFDVDNEVFVGLTKTQ